MGSRLVRGRARQSLSRVKLALSTPATLAGAIGYYRDLPLGRSSTLPSRCAAVPGLIIGGAEDLADAELFTRTAELMPSPSRALVLDGTGHWPHREKQSLVVDELQRFLAQIDS